MKSARFNNSTNVRNNNVYGGLFRSFLDFMWKVFPDMTARKAERHLFKTRRQSLSVDEKGILSLASSGAIDFQNRKIRCWTWGGGPVIVFVHGWNARGIRFLPFISPCLDAGYSVMVFDGPAHGESDGKLTNYFEFSDALKEIFSQVGISRIHGIVAHSFGAAAVINWISSAGSAPPAVFIAPALHLKEMILRTFDQQGVPSEIIEDIIQRRERFHGHDFERENPFDLIAELSSRILIIHDRQDTSVPFQGSRDAAGANPYITLSETEGLGHNRILKDPSVIRNILDFFDAGINRGDREWFPSSVFKNKGNSSSQ